MKESTSNFIMGFLAGAAAGVIAGILFAPDKGSSTRGKLKKQVLELSEEYGLGLGEMMDDLGLTEKKTRGKTESRTKRKSSQKPKTASE
jgi:gas vesicle protein